MPALDPQVSESTALNLRFRNAVGYDIAALLRDLREQNEAMNSRFALIEAILVDQQSRLVAGGL